MSSSLVSASSPQKHILDNGLTLITQEEHKAPVVTFQIWYKVGSRNEVTGKTGLAHLTEHMMFKGTKNFKSGEFSKVISQNGGSENAFTSKDYTAYYENFSSDRLEISLKFESDRMVNLIVTDEEFQTERDVVKEERRLRTEDNPQSFLIENIHAASFVNNPYHHPIVGWMDDLNNLTRDDSYNFYKNYYAPNNATIVITGDFETEDVVRLVKEYFGKIPKSIRVPASPSIVEPEQHGERKVLVKKESHLPFVLSAYKVPNYSDDDSVVLGVISSILSHGKSSRLYKKIVYEEKVALDASADYNEMTTDPYLFYFYGVLQQGKTFEEFDKLINAEIEKLKNEEVTDKELQKAKNQVESSYIFAKDSNFYQAMLIGIAETIGAGYEFLDTRLEKVRKVSKEDIMRVSKKYFVDDKRNVGILVPTVKEGGAGGGHHMGHGSH